MKRLTLNPEQDSVSGTLNEEMPDSGITNDSGFEANKMILPINADQESFPDVPESDPSSVSVITDESEVEANSVSVNRRRRRRSSATENKAERTESNRIMRAENQPKIKVMGEYITLLDSTLLSVTPVVCGGNLR